MADVYNYNHIYNNKLIDDHLEILEIACIETSEVRVRRLRIDNNAIQTWTQQQCPFSAFRGGIPTPIIFTQPYHFQPVEVEYDPEAQGRQDPESIAPAPR